MLTKISVPAASFLVIIVMARQLEPAAIGHFSIAMALYALFQFISLLGYDNIVIRDVAKDPTKSGLLIQNGLILGVLSSLLCAGCMVLASHFLHYSAPISKSIYLTTLIVFPAFVNVLAETLLIGLRKAQYAFYGSALRESLWVVLSLWWLPIYQSVDAIILAFLTSRIAGVLFFFFLFKRHEISLWEKSDGVFFKELLKIIPVFILINIFANILLESDVIILSQLVSVEDVGFYAMAKKILRIAFIVIFSVVTALFPIIAAAVNEPPGKLSRYFNSFSLRIFILAGLTVVFVYFFASHIVTLFFGAKFIKSADILQVLIFKVIPLSLSFLWSRFLISAHLQNKDVFALSMGLLTFVGLGIFWTQHIGYFGMALADITACTILALIHFYFVRQLLLRRIA